MPLQLNAGRAIAEVMERDAIKNAMRESPSTIPRTYKALGLTLTCTAEYTFGEPLKPIWKVAFPENERRKLTAEQAALYIATHMERRLG